MIRCQRRDRAVASASSRRGISAMSLPAQKARPRPETITTETSRERWSRPSASSSAIATVRSRTLSVAGRSSVSRATAPSATRLALMARVLRLGAADALKTTLTRARRQTLRAAEFEVEPPNLELLIRIRRPLHVFLQSVVLVGLDHGQPRKVLEEDPGHLPVGLAAELLVHREARGVPQLVELRVAPVVVDAARREEPPHHAVGITQRRRRIPPPQSLEALLPALLGAYRVLDHLDLHVDPQSLHMAAMASDIGLSSATYATVVSR